MLYERFPPDGLCQAVTVSVLLVANSIDLCFLHSLHFSVHWYFNVFRLRYFGKCVKGEQLIWGWSVIAIKKQIQYLHVFLFGITFMSLDFIAKPWVMLCDPLALHIKHPWGEDRMGKGGTRNILWSRKGLVVDQYRDCYIRYCLH